jgi:hypothetical protein
MQYRIDEKESIKEVPRAQRYVARPSLRGLFRGKKGREDLRIEPFMMLLFVMVIR